MAARFSSFLVFWIAAGSSICAQDVIFGSDDPSWTSCTTNEGGAGRCLEIRKCPEIRGTFFTNPPVHCGFSGTFPIVCCPVKTEPVTKDPNSGLVPIVDISPPASSQNFQCGKSSVKVIDGDFFRPEPTEFRRFRRANANIGNVALRPRPNIGILKPSVINPVVIRPPPDLVEVALVGGFKSQRNAWPWMALLGAEEGGANDGGVMNWFCAGALINDQWILTAAHCLDTITPETVRLGEHDYNDDSDGANHQDFGILKIVPYPNYTFPLAYHDLALIQLSRKVILQKFISPVCLPWGDESQKDLTGTKVKLAGWGDTKFFGSPSSTLQEVDVTMFPNSKCQENYSKLRQFSEVWPKGIGEESACAGDPNGGRDACQGDSGGPITYRSSGLYTVNGIVSRGYGCGHKDYPGIYANVQYPHHLAWIKQVAF